MTLYSRPPRYPAPLPDRIRLSSGMTRTDPSTFTPEEIADAGYVEAPIAPAYEYPSKLEWTGSDWVVSPPSEADTARQWDVIRQQCKQMLSSSDYKVIKAVEVGEAPDPVWVAYRQALRDIYNDTHSIDPWNVQWPIRPDSVMLDDYGNSDVEAPIQTE